MAKGRDWRRARHPGAAQTLAVAGSTDPRVGTAMAAVRRAQAITVRCPTCRAAAGVPCQGRRGDRKAPHAARFVAFRPSAAPQDPGS